MEQQLLTPQALELLTEAAQQTPALAPYYQFYQKLLQTQAAEKTPETLAESLESNDRATLSADQKQGKPLLAFSQLPIDTEQFTRLALAIARDLADYKTELSPDLAALAEVDWRQLAETRFAVEQVESAARQGAAETMNLAEAAASLALRPYLRGAAARLGTHVEQETWKRGYCPICGAEPHFAYLEREAGARWLICSRCEFAWLYDRVGCPFCATKTPEQLRYYPAGAQTEYRLYVCDACRRYLKAIDLRQTNRQLFRAIEPIVSAPLDLAAQEMEYS